jgi:predicted Zn-dependent peptidase
MYGVQDYLFQYRAGIEAVTPQDILAAARRHLHPRQQAVVMAADASVFQPQLEAAGMRVVPLTVD